MAKIEDLYKKEPVDIVAARVTRWKGAVYESEKRLNQELWKDGPPHCIDFPGGKEDLTGTMRGRMTIIGYLAPQDLLARCVCGNYERRDRKKWSKGLRECKDDLGCQMCIETYYLRRKDNYHRTGKKSGLNPRTKRNP